MKRASHIKNTEYDKNNRLLQFLFFGALLYFLLFLPLSILYTVMGKMSEYEQNINFLLNIHKWSLFVGFSMNCPNM